MLIDETTYAPGKQADVEAPLRPLKPSEAMRLGAAMRPQCRVQLFLEGGSCALGAIWEGLGGEHPGDALGKHAYAESHTTILGFVDNLLGGLSQSVWEKNDDGWTREQIADWLAEQGL